MKTVITEKPLRLTKAQQIELAKILHCICKELKKTPRKLAREVRKTALQAI